MNKLFTSSIKRELTSLPIARIETMDTSYVLLLREYLFTNGCQVFVNSGPTENVTYFFVVGDSNFVKKTLAFRHEIGKKQLIICWDTEDHESIDQFIDKYSKIVYIDPIPLTSAVLSEIFIFFLTSRGKQLDLQTALPFKSAFRSKEKEVPHSLVEDKNEPLYDIEPAKLASSGLYEEIQKKRISGAITDLFGKSHSKVKQLNNGGRKNHTNSQPLHRKKPLFSAFLTLFEITFSFCILTFFIYLASFLFRGLALYRASTSFREGKGSMAATYISAEHFCVTWTRLTAPFVHGFIRILAGDKIIQAYERTDRLFDTIADAESDLLALNESVLSVGSSLFFDNENTQVLSPVVTVDTIRKSIPSLRNNLDLASSYIRSLQKETVLPFFLPLVQKKMTKAAEELDRLRRVSEVGERIAQIYPFIGGFRNKEHILVALQNSSELRPTGGFIGSLAHLSVSDGSLEEMKIEDVYVLDGQLKGHVDPPDPIKRLLGQEHWYLRDSNWNPNYTKTAEMIRFFYEKETGERINSVVAITSSFIVRILRLIGPVDIPLYNDRITADNFYLKSFYYTQTNFFPGSSQKKDFLGTLMEALLAKLQSNPQSGVAVIEVMYDSLLSRDIQLYTINSEGQRVIEQFGWGGKVPVESVCLSPENQPPCLFSYLYINEANVGVNKVNAFVDRSQMRSVEISEDGTVSETVDRKIQNLSQGESGTGIYTTYLRLFFPTEYALSSLTLDGKPVHMKETKEIKSPNLPYGELDSSLPGLTGIAVACEIPPGREVVVSATVTYARPILTKNKEVLMTIFDQKQAGVDQVPTKTTIRYPLSWELVPLPSFSITGVVANPGVLEYNTMLSQDSEFSFRLMR